MRYLINICQRPSKVWGLILFCFSIVTAFSFRSQAESQNYPRQKLVRDHFVIYHDNRDVANNFGWKAEYYYKKILRHLGVANFNPWAGQNKCVILIFKNQGEYMKEMNAPDWSGGIALMDKNLFATFEGAQRVETKILPHEMTHLILAEYFGKTQIPLWLNEGMAQYEQEEGADYNYRKFVLEAVKAGKYIKLTDLLKRDYVPAGSEGIALFYAQSASVIDYMRTQLLQTQFSEFLRQIKKGRPTEEALKEVYQWKFRNGVADLEKRWLEYVTTKY